MPTSRLTNFTIILLLVGVFFAKYVDLNSFLNLPKINNFLDLRISLLDIGIVFLTLVSLGKVLKNPFRNWLPLTVFLALFIPAGVSFYTAFFGSKLGFNLLEQISNLPQIWLKNGEIIQKIIPIFNFALESSRFWLWFLILPKILRLNRGLAVSLGVTSLFDHLLFSSSLPIALAYIFTRFYGLAQKWQNVLQVTLTAYLGLNIFAIVYQIILGKSLGLTWLGEPMLNLQNTGIAKQDFLGEVFLRGYGLTQHPNLLGLVGSLGLFLTSSNNKNTNTLLAGTFGKITPKYWMNKITRLQKIFSLGLIVSSFSRASWIASLIYFWTNFRQYRIWLGVAGVLVAGLFVTKVSPDQFRFLDIQNFINSYNQVGELQKWFGVGYYPEFLSQSLANNPVWQWQPVHNFWLALVAQYGLGGSLVYATALIWKCKNRLKSSNFS